MKQSKSKKKKLRRSDDNIMKLIRNERSHADNFRFIHVVFKNIIEKWKKKAKSRSHQRILLYKCICDVWVEELFALAMAVLPSERIMERMFYEMEISNGINETNDTEINQMNKA